MFGDYVEHASGPSGLGSLPLPQVQYEGFEPTTHEQDDHNGTLDSTAPEADAYEASEPVLSLGSVQMDMPADLVSLVASSDTLAMGFASNLIMILELSDVEKMTRVTIPTKSEFTLYKIHLDPSGRHLLITSTQGENWYLFKTWKKPRLLKSWKMVIESVAWNKAGLLTSPHSTSTREMLIGGRNGTIHEALLDAEEDFFKSHERYIQPVFSLQERLPVTGIKFDFYPTSDPRRILVIVTTPSRIYQFVGSPEKKNEEGGRLFANLFANYREIAPKISEVPGNIQHSELQFFTPNADQAQSLPKGIAWSTGLGIYHGQLNFQSSSDDMIDGASLLAYPNSNVTPSSPNSSQESSAPASIALTEFHFILLFKNRVVGICTLDEKTIYDELLPLTPREEVVGISADPVRHTYWVYTNKSIYELDITKEDRDIWKIYLDQSKFDIALRYAKKASQRDLILAAQAEAYFAQGRYFQAAQSYAQCSTTFEEVTLKFLDVGERDALRSYLISRLERTKRTDLSQRMMLATWLVEFYLSKCNELDDLIASESVSNDVENLQTERSILEEDLRQFFQTYKANLDPSTIYELIQGHGRTDMYLYYASVVGNYERVVEHWIDVEEWTKAIEVVSKQNTLEMYYRFSPVLMRQAPKETTESWLRQPALDPLRLIPALLQLQHAPRDPLSPNYAVRYLNHVIFEQHNTSSTIHNLILTFHAASPPSDDAALLRFLSTAPLDSLTQKPYYDLDYALRLCKQSGHIQPCVHIYGKMGLWENSVDLALDMGDLELAKINADMPEDDVQLRKKLWLKIARYVVQEKGDIKTAMQFLDNADLLKIEDILPFFPDFVVIDDFKEEIAHALEGYSAHIDTLKGEMEEATKAAEAIKQDISALKNRFVTIDAGERCSHCSHLLFTRQFYVFPCQHTFHADCLISLAKEYLPAHALRRIVNLQSELVKNTQTPLVLDQPIITGPLPTQPGQNGRHTPTTQRTLLSSTFVNPLQNGTRAANALGRNLLSAGGNFIATGGGNLISAGGSLLTTSGGTLLSAGDKLKDMIVPDTLAAMVSSPAWIPGVGGTGKKGGLGDKTSGEKAEKVRKELDEMLTSACPLCENVVVGLDRPFVNEGEIDTSWEL